MKQKISFLLFFLLFMGFAPMNLSGQKEYIQEQPSITAMMRSWINFNQAEEKVRGWRIQIITTDDRRKMDRTRSKFAGLYPDIPTTWEHESPYYKVQIGAYDNKLELQAFLQEIKGEFPLAIPIMDDIKKTELIK
jgi:hypothetical protein